MMKLLPQPLKVAQLKMIKLNLIHNYFGMMNYYTFEQLKEIAAENGITGSNVKIGLWA